MNIKSFITFAFNSTSVSVIAGGGLILSASNDKRTVGKLVRAIGIPGILRLNGGACYDLTYVRSGEAAYVNPHSYDDTCDSVVVDTEDMSLMRNGLNAHQYIDNMFGVAGAYPEEFEYISDDMKRVIAAFYEE